MPVTAYEKAQVTALEDSLLRIEKLISEANQQAARIADIVDYDRVVTRLANARAEITLARHSF